MPYPNPDPLFPSRFLLPASNIVHVLSACLFSLVTRATWDSPLLCSLSLYSAACSLSLFVWFRFWFWEERCRLWKIQGKVDLSLSIVRNLLTIQWEIREILDTVDVLERLDGFRKFGSGYTCFFPRLTFDWLRVVSRQAKPSHGNCSGWIRIFFICHENKHHIQSSRLVWNLKTDISTLSSANNRLSIDIIFSARFHEYNTLGSIWFEK